MKKKFLSIILAAVMATCGVFAAGCGKENKTTNKTPTSEEIIIDGKEEEAIPMPKAMSFSAPKLLSDSGEPVAQTSSVTLTATVEPSDATYQAVDWSVSFVNQSSTWASGKTASDYVTVTPTSDGALTATVECLSAFGEQINVTVTSRDNADASATCVCDYIKRIIDLNLTMLQSASVSDTITFSRNSSDVTFSAEPVYDIGTKEIGFSITKSEVRKTDELLGVLLENFSNSPISGRGVNKTWCIGRNDLSDIVELNTGEDSFFLMLYLNASASEKTELCEIYNNYVNSGGNVLKYEVSISQDDTGVNLTKTLEIKGNPVDFTVAVSSVKFDLSSLEF